MSSRSVATVAVFAALIAAVGFLLAGLPNVELVSLMTFVAGATLGPRGGATAGAVGMALYSSFNPYGMAPPPVFVTQVAGCALIGAGGGLLGPRLRSASRLRSGIGLGAAGLALTILFDGLTNYGTAVSIGAALNPWPVIAAGWAFGVLHLFWNTLFFAALGPTMLRVSQRFRERNA